MSFALEFSPPRVVETRFGMRQVETAFATPEFWAAWKAAKDSLRDMGYEVTKNADKRWIVNRVLIPTEKKPAPEVVGYKIKQVTGLLPYQVSHASALCAAIYKYNAALDASDTGTGKTYSALAVCREFGVTPAIVCPLSVIPSWERVLKHFKMDALFIKNWEGCKSKKFGHGGFDEHDKYTWRLNRRVMLIFDEAHKAKGEYTLNSKMVIAAAKQEIPMMLLSATIATTPREMRAMGFALGLHSLLDFRTFCLTYGCFQNQWNGWECANPKEAMQKISSEIFPARGSRMRIAELGDAFPECQISADAYVTKAVKKQNDEYKALLLEIEKLKAAKKQNVQAAILSLNLRFRQFAELCKVDLLEDLAKDALENGLSVALFVNFTATLDELASRLKAVTVHGQQTGTERQEAIDAFQSNKKRVIVLNIQAGGAGISLHDLEGDFPRLGLVCPTYRATDLKQVLGRIHRAGAKSKALYRLIYASGTIEEKICKSVARKLAAISTLNDGDLMEPDILGVLGK